MLDKQKNRKIKLNSLDLVNQTNMLNITPVTFASLYDPTDQNKIAKHNLVVLIDKITMRGTRPVLPQTKCYKNCVQPQRYEVS